MRAEVAVKEFHLTFGRQWNLVPAIQPKEVEELRMRLIEEELQELKDALADKDIVEIADALGDLVYVIYGMAGEYGIPLEVVIAEIHNSNMSKLGQDGKPIIREDGKILKGPSYFKPDILHILKMFGWRPNV